VTKFWVYASERVYYAKLIETESIENVRDMIENEEIHFENNDAIDWLDFRIDEKIDQEL